MNEPDEVEPLLLPEGPPAHVWSAVLAAAVSADPARADELAVLLPEPTAEQLEPLEAEPGWVLGGDLGPTHLDDPWDAAPESHHLHDPQDLDAFSDPAGGDDPGGSQP
ncbi:hypothetical protein [Oryzobacter telluris]|uniref:hypothetical protein n=1 Tax=Oryzobacter telluris TaxID=3149179 RepID=UPI00370DBD9A